MTAELLAQIEPVGEAPAPRDGWRGLIDFGEIWSEADADLAWPPESGIVPVGEPLVYGCEVTYAEGDERVRVRFIALDSLRPVMVPGARFHAARRCYGSGNRPHHLATSSGVIREHSASRALSLCGVTDRERRRSTHCRPVAAPC